MCLTEPNAGSDVGNVKTKAVRREDGAYEITGQKIFINGGPRFNGQYCSYGLARIEGDPPGTRGAFPLYYCPNSSRTGWNTRQTKRCCLHGD